MPAHPPARPPPARPSIISSAHPPPATRPAVHPSRPFAAMPTPIQPSDLTKSIPVNPLYPGHAISLPRTPERPPARERQADHLPPTQLTNIYPPCGDVGICDTRVCVCVLFVSSRSGIVFKPIVSVITDKSRSVKDIDQYSTFQLYVADPASRKTVRILPYSKPGERAHDRNCICDVSRIRTHSLLILSPAYYHIANHNWLLSHY